MDGIGITSSAQLARPHGAAGGGAAPRMLGSDSDLVNEAHSATHDIGSGTTPGPHPAQHHPLQHHVDQRQTFNANTMHVGTPGGARVSAALRARACRWVTTVLPC